MITSWYFIWFVFRVIALMVHAASFNVVAQPFTVAIKPPLWAIKLTEFIELSKVNK
jgi:hypothetical protein